MIKINLASRKQPSQNLDAKGGGKSILGGLAKFDTRLDGMKDLPLRKILLMVAVGIGASYLADDYKQSEVAKLDASIKKLTTEQSKLNLELGKIKGFEGLKKQLDGDEYVLRTKIETIEKLIVDRQAPPKILMTLARTIPDDVWLSGFKIANAQVSIQGASLGFNQISDFMKNLNESAYFTDLRLQNTQQVKDVTGEAATFELLARLR